MLGRHHESILPGHLTLYVVVNCNKASKMLAGKYILLYVSFLICWIDNLMGCFLSMIVNILLFFKDFSPDF